MNVLSFKKISIIVPTLNEGENILQLVTTIHKSLTASQISYEIIFIDDHSTDKTVDTIEKLQKKYPLTVYTKVGKKGKAQSLLEGFSYARYPYISFIDADLQYPPSAIPAMLQSLIETNVDVIVANRSTKQTASLRNIISSSFQFIFARLLHNFSYDVQSGLKLFKTEILQKVRLQPTAWGFDLEFLVKARDAGYKIGSFDILFQKRHFGSSKVNIIPTAFSLGVNAIKLKFRSTDYIQFKDEQKMPNEKGIYIRGKKYVNYSELAIHESATYVLNIKQKILLLLSTFLVVFAFMHDWHITIVVCISLLTLLYFIDLFFNLYIVMKSYFSENEIHITPQSLTKVAKDQLPLYTILCPMYKEANVIPQFIQAMDKLDYPREKLQIMFLLEEDDSESIDLLQNYQLPAWYEIHILANSQPKTKPKALNYGLAMAQGTYLVIYDTEDVPDPLQLKKVVLAFAKAKDNTICMQAKLNFYNPYQNLLTIFFTLEYSLWFDLILTGLQSMYALIPLGGTSNHFKTEALRKLNGWDAFNVTEDADLGIRIMKQGYKTAIVNSYTMEEANSDVANWFRQRSRWVKGYMQTYLVHMRSPQSFFKGKNKAEFFTFQIIIGGKILSLLINPLMWAITIIYFAYTAHVGLFIRSFFLPPILYIAVISLVVGNSLYIYYYMLGVAKRKQWDLVPFALLVPLYWLAMSLAALLALWELGFKPHHWQKTKHGLHINKTMSFYERFIGSIKKSWTVVPQSSVN